MAAPLARPGGGTVNELAKLQAAISEVPLLIHSPPDIPADAEIMGVCALSNNLAGTNQYAWIGVDFLRWKTLFHRVGKAEFQHWFGTLDIQKLSKNTIDFDKNFPGAHDAIFGTKCGIADLPANNDEFIAAFLTEVAARARAADERGTTMFLMVFSPVTPDRDIVVDFDERAQKKFAYLTIDKIRSAIRDAVNHDKLPVILMTESPLTGGWMCNPSLFGAAAAQHPVASVLEVIARSCGGIFADTFMNSFIKRSTPLLTDEQRSNVQYEDMRPIGATEQQTRLLHKFQRTIHESLQSRLSPLGKRHMLFHEPETDAWSILDTRKGYPLVGFWSAKVAAPEWIDGSDRFEFLGEAFGGTRESQIFHLKYLVAIEFDTCPGDWTRNLTGITAQTLEFYSNLKPDIDACKRAYDAIEFRGSAITLAEVLVKALGLPIPEEKCRYWVDRVREDPFYAKLQAGFADVHNLLDLPAIFPGEIRHAYKHVRFFRPARWISAALAQKMGDKTDREIRTFIANEIAPLIAMIREVQESILLQNRSLMGIGETWIQSLNLGIDLGSDVPGHNLAPVSVPEERQYLPVPVKPDEETKSGMISNGPEAVGGASPAPCIKETPAEPPNQTVDLEQKADKLEIPRVHEPAKLAVDGDDFWSKVTKFNHTKSALEPVVAVNRLAHWDVLQETPDMQKADDERQRQQATQAAHDTTLEEASETPTEDIAGIVSVGADTAVERPQPSVEAAENETEGLVTATPEPEPAPQVTTMDDGRVTVSAETVNATIATETEIIQPLANVLAGMNPEQRHLLGNKLMELAKSIVTNGAPTADAEVAGDLSVAISHVGISDATPNDSGSGGSSTESTVVKAETDDTDMFRLTPPQTPQAVSVRPSEDPCVTDGVGDGGSDGGASDGVVESEDVTIKQEDSATHEAGLVAGEDFWSRVKW